jgi:hypothetical protein
MATSSTAASERFWKNVKGRIWAAAAEAGALGVLQRGVDGARLREEEDSMNAQITGLRVASVVFGLMALAQLVRLVIRPEVLVAGHPMPLWPSVLAFIILGGLSLWMWNLARTPTK